MPLRMYFALLAAFLNVLKQQDNSFWRGFPSTPKQLGLGHLHDHCQPPCQGLLGDGGDLLHDVEYVRILKLTNGFRVASQFRKVRLFSSQVLRLICFWNKGRPPIRKIDFFRALPKLPLPPPSPQFGQVVQLFLDVKNNVQCVSQNQVTMITTMM